MIRALFIRLFGHLPLSREEARDWSAILYTPFLSLFLAAQVVSFTWGPWPAESADLRLKALACVMIINALLIGLGTLFLQRRTANIKVETPAGSFEIDDVTQG
jgi:hypothetical protein